MSSYLSRLHAITYSTYNKDRGFSTSNEYEDTGVHLTTDQKEHIKIMIRNGYKNDETAQAVGCSPNSVSKTRVKLQGGQ